MAVVTGQRTTGNVAAGQRKIDMARDIALLDPNANPFTTILNETAKGGQRQKTVNPKFQWAEDEREVRWGKTTGTATTSDTTLTVGDSSVFYPGALVKVPRTGETVRVATLASGTSITVVRGIGGSTAVAMTATEDLLVMSGSNDEGARSREIRTQNPTFAQNYTQIFRTSVGESGTWRSSENETNPGDPSHQRNKKGIEHQLDKEYAALFGVPSETTGTDGPLRTTGGLDYFCTANRQDAAGTLTEANWDKFIVEKAFKHGSSEKTLLASPFLISVLMGFSKSKLTTSVGQSKYGVNYIEHISPSGKLAIVPHKLLEGTVYGGYGYVIDYKGAEVKYRYLDSAPGGSRDTKLLTNRQASDLDGQKDEYLTEAGFQIGQAKKHAVIYGVTA